jgi:hypothetical protein
MPVFNFFWLDFYKWFKEVAKYKIKGCLIFEVSYFACSQIWLNLPMDDHHFGYITKFDQKKKTIEPI